MTLAPNERVLRGRIAANARWKNTPDRAAATVAARNGMTRKFEREVDPEGLLSPDELAKRVANARAEHMQRMAFLSARARRRRGAINRTDATHPTGGR